MLWAPPHMMESYAETPQGCEEHPHATWEPDECLPDDLDVAPARIEGYHFANFFFCLGRARTGAPARCCEKLLRSGGWKHKSSERKRLVPCRSSPKCLRQLTRGRLTHVVSFRVKAFARDEKTRVPSDEDTRRKRPGEDVRDLPVSKLAKAWAQCIRPSLVGLGIYIYMYKS